MTDESLESPGSAEDLYLAASPDEVPAARPIMTGDVFESLAIPGLSEPGMAIVLTHPCSMRSDGVQLADRLLLGQVRPGTRIPLEKWATGHYRVMPLPGLLGGHFVASFDEIGLVASNEILTARRLACLTPYGANLLQQRLVWYLTRFVAPTHRLAEATGAVFEEADLCEEWVARRSEMGDLPGDAAVSFHEWIRGQDASGVSRQALLAEPQRRAGLRRDMRRQLSA